MWNTVDYVEHIDLDLCNFLQIKSCCNVKEWEVVVALYCIFQEIIEKIATIV